MTREKATKVEVGEVLGKNNALLVKELIKKEQNGKKSTLYVVQCQICKDDPVLHGDAIYTIAKGYFLNGKLPCGCSKNAKYSKERWFTILSRKAVSNNHVLVGFVNVGGVSQESKLVLECNTCSHKWQSCSIGNYMKDRGCPVCANRKRGESTVKPDDAWIKRFRDTGFFPESKFAFERVAPRSRLWNVYCYECANDIPFVSDRSNLVASKVPCNCVTGGGFDVSRLGYFYVLTVLINGVKSIKYGITNVYKRRLSDHKRTLGTIGGVVLDEQVFSGIGTKVLALESAIKRAVPADNKNIDGFRSEACSEVFLNTILKCVKIVGLEPYYISSEAHASLQ